MAATIPGSPIIDPHREPVRYLLGVALCAGLGGFLVWGGCEYDRRARAVGRWPTVEATVDWVRVTDGLVINPGASRHRPGFELRVSYHYSAGGERHDAEEAVFGASDLAEVEAERAKFGSTIRVHVDPRDPSRSHARPPRPSRGIHPAVVIGGVLLVLAGVGVGAGLGGQPIRSAKGDRR